MQQLVRQIHTRLLEQKLTIAVAESCTGGLLASRLTSLPGSSAYFLLGVVAYSNRAKAAILGVPAPVIKQFGAVSRQTCLAMARGAGKQAGSDCAVAITGIAGPGGGTRAKPVGTVWICCLAANKQDCRRFRFAGGRAAVRSRAAAQALRMLAPLL